MGRKIKGDEPDAGEPETAEQETEGVNNEAAIGETGVAADGESAAAATEAPAGLDATTAADPAAPAETLSGDDGDSSDAGDADAGAGADADAGPAVERDVFGDPLLTFDTVKDWAAQVLFKGFDLFIDAKPNQPTLPLEGGNASINPIDVLADFYLANPDAPLAAGLQQLRLKRFGALAGAEDNAAVTLQLTLFRAVIDAGLAFMKAEQAAVAEQARQAQPAQTWGGELAYRPEPSPFTASGFTAR